MDLSFIIIFGTRWTFRPVKGGREGVLNCPDCKTPQVFQEKEAVKAFTLYWKPLWTVERGGHLVECKHCGGRFDVPEELGGPKPPPGRAGAAPARPATA